MKSKANYIKLILLSTSIFLHACSENPSSYNSRASIEAQNNPQGEIIFRKNNEVTAEVDSMTPLPKEIYPWENDRTGIHSKITQHFFRCKGNLLNPVKIIQKEKESIYIYDCGGPLKHSLPIKNGKEFIYPILIELLNYIQNKTEKKVIITCGHCCLEHNRYLNELSPNFYSKHLIGAEVDFYVQGMENEPQKVVDLLLNYYQTNVKYQGKNSFSTFQRYSKDSTNVSIQPWFNEEVFIKLFSPKEGRDFDNKHSYPYISIQVRYDWDLKKKVNFSTEDANHFYRY